MAVTVSGFTSETTLKGGHNGLIVTTGKTSKITITGTGLSNGLLVTILDPPGSSSPTYQWDGRTADTNSSGTQCKAEVTQKKTNPEGDKDDPTTVSVTAGGSSSTNVDTYTGTAPP